MIPLRTVLPILAALAAGATEGRDSSGRRDPLDPLRCSFSKWFRAGDEYVFALSVSRGRGLACAGRRDGAVQVWDAWGWTEARRIQAHEGYCYQALFSPDGKRLASCGLDGAVKLWDTDEWTLDRTLRASGEPIVALAFASGGRRLVAGGAEGVFVYSLGEKRGMSVLRGHALGVSALAASGDRAVTAGVDGELRFWDLAKEKEIRTVAAHAGPVYALAFHPAGRWVASTGADGAIRLWDASSGEKGRAFEGRVPVRALAFTSAGDYLVAGGADGVRVWEFSRGRVLRSLDTAGVPACGVAIGLGGRQIVATGTDNRVRLWGAEGRGGDLPADDRPIGFLGVSYVDGGGAFVRSIFQGSQAEKSGFQANDVIVGVDDTSIEKSEDFLNFMRRSREGDEINVKVKRGDQVKVIRAKLGRWQDQ